MEHSKSDISVSFREEAAEKTKLLLIGVAPEESDIPLIAELQDAGWAVGLALLKKEVAAVPERVADVVDLMVCRPYAKTGDLFRAALGLLKHPQQTVFVDMQANGGLGPAEDCNFLTVELADAHGVFSDFIAKRQELNLSEALIKVLDDGVFLKEKEHARPIDFAEENRTALPIDLAEAAKDVAAE